MIMTIIPVMSAWEDVPDMLTVNGESANAILAITAARGAVNDICMSLYTKPDLLLTIRSAAVKHTTTVGDMT